jgi:hypothetical protein
MQQNLKFEARSGKGSSKTLSQKQNKNKRSVGRAQVVGCLPSMHKALSLIPSTREKKKEKRNEKKMLEFRFKLKTDLQTSLSFPIHYALFRNQKLYRINYNLS